jgi:hypothetical protein
LEEHKTANAASKSTCVIARISVTFKIEYFQTKTSKVAERFPVLCRKSALMTWKSTKVLTPQAKVLVLLRAKLPPLKISIYHIFI